MTALDIFYIAAAIALLAIGGGIGWVCYQVVQTLALVRATILPNVDLTLTEVQKNLNRIDDLTKDVDTTVSEANELVNTANRTVRSVENGIGRFNENVVVPSLITLASAREGFKSAWATYQRRRELQKAEAPAAPAITRASEAPAIDVLAR